MKRFLPWLFGAIGAVGLAGVVVGSGLTVIPASWFGAGPNDAAGAPFDPTIIATEVPALETVRTVTAAAAADAAITGRDDRMLLAFFDAVAGDSEGLEQRATALVTQLNQDARFADPKVAQATLGRLRVAVNRALGSAYVAPAVIDGRFTPVGGVTGWDLGGVEAAPAAGFERVTLGDEMIHGAKAAVIAHDSAAGSLADGVLHLERFTAVLPDGDYRLVFLSRADTNGVANPYPFGTSLKQDDASRRLIEAWRDDGATYEPYVWVEADQRGLKTHQLATLGQPLEEQEAAKIALQSAAAEQRALALVVPVRIRGGKTSLAFAPSVKDPIQIDAVLAVPADYTTALKRIDSLLASATPRSVPAPKTQAEAAEQLALSEIAFTPPPALLPVSGYDIAMAAAQGAGRAAPALAPGNGPAGGSWVMLDARTHTKALAGAIAGTAAGLADLQAYLDEAGGDSERLQQRSLRLIEALGQRSESGDFVGVAETTNRITEATQRSAGTSYVMRGQIRRDVRLGDGAIGYDFAGAGKPIYAGFRRVDPGSRMISGRNLSVVDLAPWRSNLTTEGISGVERVRLPLPNGTYRLYLYAPKLYQPGGSPAAFGEQIRINGNPLRRVDLRNSPSPETWFRHSAPGVTVKGGLEGVVEGLSTQADLERIALGQPHRVRVAGSEILSPSGHCGLVLATRAVVDDGQLVIDIDPGAGGRPTLAGIVAVPDGFNGPQSALAERVASLLGDVSPAAGSGVNSAGIMAQPNLPAFVSNGFRGGGRSGSSGFGGSGGVPFVPFGGGGGGGGGSGSGGDTTTSGTTTSGTTTSGTTTSGTTTSGTTTSGTTTSGTTTSGTTTSGTTTSGTTTSGTTTSGTTTSGTTTSGTTTSGTTTSGTTTSGTTTSGTTTSGTTTSGTTTSGTTTSGTTTSGTTTSGTTTSGTTTSGTTTSGTTTSGTTTSGTTTSGTTTSGTTTSGTTTSGTTTSGTTTSGTTTSGTTTSGTTTSGTTTSGTTTSGTTTSGTTTSGTTTSGTTTSGTTTSGTTTSGTTTSGTTTSGTTTSGTTTSGTTTSGTTTSGTTTSGTTTSGTTTSGTTTSGTTTSGTTTSGTTTSGTTTSGTTTSGTTTSGTTTSGTTTSGTTTSGTTTSGTTTSGTTTSGTTTSGTTTSGTTTSGTTTSGTTTSGTTTSGTTTSGTTTSGTTTSGTTTSGTTTSGTTTSGTTTSGTTTSGTTTSGTTTSGTTTSGTTTSGTTTSGTTSSGSSSSGGTTIVMTAATGRYEICLGENAVLQGTGTIDGNAFNATTDPLAFSGFDLNTLSVTWLYATTPGGPLQQFATGMGLGALTQTVQTGPGAQFFDIPRLYDLVIQLTYRLTTGELLTAQGPGGLKVCDNCAEVSEPHTLPLFAAGGLLLWAIVRRRRARAA